MNIKDLTKRINSGEDIESVLKDIINKTYHKVENILEKSSNDLQSALLEDLDSDEGKEMKNEIDIKLNKTRKELSKALKLNDVEEDRPKSLKTPEKKLKFLGLQDNERKINIQNQFSPISTPQDIRIELLDQNPDIEVVNVAYSPIQITKKPQNLSPISEIPAFNPKKSVKTPEKPPAKLICLQFNDIESSIYSPELIFDRPSAPFQDYDSDEDKSPKIETKTDEIIDKSIEKIIRDTLQDSFQTVLIEATNHYNPKIPLLDLISLSELPLPTISSTEPGIQIGPDAINKYLTELYTYIQKHPHDVTTALKTPLKKNPLSVLTKLQEIDIGSMAENEKFQMVIELPTYIKLEQTRGDISTRNGLSPHILHVITESEHIHNRMVFDTINQLLNKYRPYGNKGLPMP